MSDLYPALTRDPNDITKDLILLADDGTKFTVHSKLVFHEWPTLMQFLKAGHNLRNLRKKGIESKLNFIKVNIRPLLLDLIINHCYNIELDLKNQCFTIAEQLLESARELELNSLIEKVFNCLFGIIMPSNCLSLWKLSRHYYSKNSYQIFDYVLYNLMTHINSSLELLNDWYRLDIDEVTLILGDSHLKVAMEKDVWMAMVIWINADRNQRKEYAKNLSKLLRFSTKYDAFTFYVNDTSELLPKNFVDEAVNQKIEKRIPRDVIVVIGGSNRENRQINLVDVEIFDKRTADWNKCAMLAGLQNTSNTLAVIDKEIFSMGGRNGKCSVNSLTPPCRNSPSVWRERAPMYSNRIYAASCVSNGKIYVLGGYANDDILNTAERYDPKTNQWTKLPNMPTNRSSLAAVALNGKIYAIGGTDGRSMLNSVDVYDEETNIWFEGQPLLSARKAHSAVLFNNGILIAGGLCTIPSRNSEDDLMAQNTTEFFNPIINKWISEAPMDYARFHFAMVVFDNEVYAIGGQINFECALNAVEKFDGREWRINSFLKSGRGYHKACVLQNWPCTEALLNSNNNQNPTCLLNKITIL